MNIEVCYTPDLIQQFDLKGKTVVVIDILRATSCMVAGLNSGVNTIKPVASIEECLALGKKVISWQGSVVVKKWTNSTWAIRPMNTWKQG